MHRGRFRFVIVGGLVCLFVGLLAAFSYAGPALASPPADVSTASSVNVTTTDDVVNPNDGVCSLREVVTRLGGCAGDTIYLQPEATYVLTDILAGDLAITTATDMTITVAGGGHAVIQGNTGWEWRILRVESPASVLVTIQGVTIQGGRPSYSNQSGAGGGIYNTGRLVLIDSRVTSNTALLGGGIFNAGSLSLTNALVSSNTAITGGIASLGMGGGIYSLAYLSLESSAVVSNTAEKQGGGIFVEDNFNNSAALQNVTLSGNLADEGGGLFVMSPTDLRYVTVFRNTATTKSGGGMVGGATITLASTIVAGNSAASNSDCSGNVLSNGYNLIQNNCEVNAAVGDLFGIGYDPLLGPLQDNGGPTPTHALSSSSPAMNRVPSGEVGCGTTVAVDQRGIVSRPQGNACDIGAFELESNSRPEAYLPLIKR